MRQGVRRDALRVRGRAATVLGLLLAGACGSGMSGARDAGPDSGRVGIDQVEAGTDTLVPGDAPIEVAGDGPGEEHPCTSDLDCDDGNPRTLDSCYRLQGVCLHRISECLVDIDCEDHDPYTDDRCQRDPGSLDAVCVHQLLPGRCHTATDCNDELPCSTETCVSRVCRYQVPESCVLHCEAYPRCGLADGLGMPCGSLPVARPDCLAVAGRCPELHLCGETFYGGYAAGSACPSAPCPADPPASGSACGPAPRRCDYGTRPGDHCSTGDYGPTTSSGSALSGTHPVGHPRCDCIRGSWYCTVEVCPLTPPADGTETARPPAGTAGGGSCTYQNLECSIQADTGGGGTYHWRCVYPRPCPLTAVDGATCDRSQDDFCSYRRLNGAQPPDTYDGDCRCGSEGRWHCEPNQAADCPLVAPVMVLGCTSTPGNRNCVYFDGMTSTVTYRCHCSGLWQCSRQAGR